MQLEPRILQNRFARLEPIDEAHREALRALADDPQLWRFIPEWGHGAHFDAMFDGRLARAASGEWIHFSVRHPTDGGLVGQTGFLAIDPVNARVEIGATWYGAPHQGGALNPACKLLLMGAAFAARARRVEFKTDARNARSRAAIAKLGATQEGVLRRHILMPDGFVRDTVYFSVLDDEWPTVRARLEARLEALS